MEKDVSVVRIKQVIEEVKLKYQNAQKDPICGIDIKTLGILLVALDQIEKKLCNIGDI